MPRPISVTIIAILLMITGAGGLLFHLADFKPHGPFDPDIIWVAIVRALAVVAGAYLLRGRNWARWLAVAWIAFHVVVGALNSAFQFAIHALFCAVFVFFLFRPTASRYFRSTGAQNHLTG